MILTAWVIAGLATVAAIVFCVLWLSARKRVDTVASAAPAGSDAIDVFYEDTVYQLLAKGSVTLNGQPQSFGVAQSTEFGATAFLHAGNIAHLQTNDSFSLRNGQLYKVDQRKAPPAAAPAPAAAAAAVAPAAQAAVSEDEFTVLNKGNDSREELTVMLSSDNLMAEMQKLTSALPYLEVLEGPDSGQKFQLGFDHSTIGRHESNTVALAETGSSRLHCEIFYDATEFVLRDAQSTNGTLCNEQLIDEKVLEFGDRIRVADTVMMFSCRGYDLKESDPAAAIDAFEQCLDHEPDFLLALNNLAFLLERDLRRKKEAEPLWKRIQKLER